MGRRRIVHACNTRSEGEESTHSCNTRSESVYFNYVHSYVYIVHTYIHTCDMY